MIGIRNTEIFATKINRQGLTTQCTDQMWQIIHCEIRLVKVRHNTKQACLQGGLLWNQYTDPIEGEKCYNFM